MATVVSPEIERVQNLKVTLGNPPRDDLDGLDFERCAALHNAIVKHGWVGSGRALEQMPKTTWWENQSTNPGRDDTTSRLHDFILQHAGEIDLGFKEDLDDPDYDNRFYTLYSTDQTHASKPDDLVYDQETHMCILSLNTDDPSTDDDLPWQKLETVLTVYIEMIEIGKVVAAHKGLEFEDDWAFYEAPDPALSGFRLARDRPNAMLRDPVSGLTKKREIVAPWMCVSNTEADLEDTLSVWEALVEALHSRMGITDQDDAPVYGLTDEQLLGAVPDSFAKHFLARALKPHFTHIAPGLRIQTPEEMLHQPYASFFGKEEENTIPPILLFRGTGSAQPTVPLGRYPHIAIPTGLYLEPCNTFADAAPWEDGAALILPYSVGGHGSWARMADGKPLPARNDSLYQIGRNPFIAPHATPLLAILMSWYRNVESGYWKVGEDGVVGGMDKWREADTEEHCMKYVVEIGAGIGV